MPFRTDIDLILPLKLGPHTSELVFRACGGLDVIHYVDMNVVQDDNLLFGGSRSIVHNRPEYDAGVSGRDLDCSL